MASAAPVPAPGLYRTLFPLVEGQPIASAGALVCLEGGDDGETLVRLPEGTKSQRWVFRSEGHTVRDLEWLTTLVPLPPEGLYRLGQELWLGGGQRFPKGLLGRLGYTRVGRGALFAGRLGDEGSIHFLQRGALVTDLQLDTLHPANFQLLRLKGPGQQAIEAASDEQSEGET